MEVLLYSSSALSSFSVDDFDRHLRPPQGRRRLQGLRRVLPAGPCVGSHLDMAVAAVALSASKYLKG
jgi:hypothetical protein